MGERIVEIEYDDTAYDIIEKVGELLDEYDLIFDEYWDDTVLVLKIEKIGGKND